MEEIGMAILHLNQDNFDKTINAAETALVDFWAPWCGPWKKMQTAKQPLQRLMLMNSKTWQSDSALPVFRRSFFSKTDRK